MIPAKFQKKCTEQKDEKDEKDEKENQTSTEEIIIRLLDGQMFTFTIRNVKGKRYREESIIRQVLNEFKTNHNIVFRKNRVKLSKMDDIHKNIYFLVQDPPDVKKYVQEDEETGTLEISIKSMNDGLYGKINLNDLIDWLEMLEKGDITYETVSIRDCSLEYQYKIKKCLEHIPVENGYESLPIIPFSAYTDYEDNEKSGENEFLRFFSLINEKLGATSIEWYGPKLPINLLLNGFPNAKKLSLSFPVDKEDMQKFSWLSSLEEVECMLGHQKDEEIYLNNITVNIVNYIWRKQDKKIEKIEMGLLF